MGERRSRGAAELLSLSLMSGRPIIALAIDGNKENIIHYRQASQNTVRDSRTRCAVVIIVIQSFNNNCTPNLHFCAAEH